jgi:hypothetical protein
VIGSEEWHKNWHVGLEDSSSDSETEKVSDQFSESDSESDLPIIQDRSQVTVPFHAVRLPLKLDLIHYINIALFGLLIAWGYSL